MHVLLYNQLHPQRIPNFQKMKRFLETGDFRSADVKKVGHNLYRARLDSSNRLVFSHIPPNYVVAYLSRSSQAT